MILTCPQVRALELPHARQVADDLVSIRMDQDDGRRKRKEIDRSADGVLRSTAEPKLGEAREPSDLIEIRGSSTIPSVGANRKTIIAECVSS